MMTPSQARAAVFSVDEQGSAQHVPMHLAMGRALAETIDEALGLVDGAALGPATLALLAERGVESIPTYPPIGVGLVTIDRDYAGETRPEACAAAFALAAATGLAGQIPVDMCATPADDELHAAALGRAFEMAEIVCTVGAGAGAAAMIRDRLGGEVKFDRVTQSPGGEMAFAVLDDGWWFGLPGAPGDALACFQFYVVPLARKLAGFRQFDLPTLEAPFAAPPPAGNNWRLAWANIVRGAAPALQILSNDANPLLAVAQADGLILLPPGAAPDRATLHLTR
jgi:molybdopterin biosynthesis enzyme